MSFPLVSIIIPTYNQASYIERAVKSALSQSYINIEIIIADDHSSDDIIEHIKGFLSDKRIKYFKNKKNIGRVKNYKKSIEEYASGEWVLVLDGDDYLTDNDFISDAIQIVLSDKKIVFVQAGHTMIGSNINFQPIISVPDIKYDFCKVSGSEFFLNFDNRFSHLSTLYNRSLANSINFYRFNILSSDIESMLRLSLLGKVVLLKKSVGVWFQHPSNATRNPSLYIHLKNLLLYKYCKEFAIQHGISKSLAIKWQMKCLQKYVLNEIKKSWQDEKNFNINQLFRSLKILKLLFIQFKFNFLSFGFFFKMFKILLIKPFNHFRLES